MPVPERHDLSTPRACAGNRVAGLLPEPLLEDWPRPCRHRRACTCASASSRRASGCFGLSVMTLQKHSTASCMRCCACSRRPRLLWASMWLGSTRMADPIRRLGLGQPALRPEDHAEIAVRVGVTGVERDGPLERAAARSSSSRSRKTMPRLLCQSAWIGLERRCSARSTRRPGLCAPAGGRARPSSAAQRRGRARPRGSSGRCRPPPPTARSAAAGWRSSPLRPG